MLGVTVRRQRPRTGEEGAQVQSLVAELGGNESPGPGLGRAQLPCLQGHNLRLRNSHQESSVSVNVHMCVHMCVSKRVGVLQNACMQMYT